MEERIKVEVDVDTCQLDSAIEKAEYLVELLEKSESLMEKLETREK
ncbi:hypothetical protein [Paenibacillus sp. Marseille-Q4541]|nr:hypothetical protein [Paenibacillus sp. Marseille-Q4541]